MAEFTGRCLCGQVTWESDGPVNWAGHCHCRSCRRACSAPFTSFFGIDRDKVRWTGEIAVNQSSPTVRRGYCPSCGSQVHYQAEKWSHETHLYAATLDDPAKFQPKAHFHWAEKVDWVTVADDLPKYAHTAEGAEPLDI